MEKISGIVPSSPRTRKVDVSSSQPVRPGAPSFGRNVGKNSLRENANIDRVQLGASQLPDSASYKNQTEKMHAQMVADLNKKFFARDPVQVKNEIQSQMPVKAQLKSESESELQKESLRPDDPHLGEIATLKAIVNEPLKSKDLVPMQIDPVEVVDQVNDLENSEQ